MLFSNLKEICNCDKRFVVGTTLSGLFLFTLCVRVPKLREKTILEILIFWPLENCLLGLYCTYRIMLRKVLLKGFGKLVNNHS